MDPFMIPFFFTCSLADGAEHYVNFILLFLCLSHRKFILPFWFKIFSGFFAKSFPGSSRAWHLLALADVLSTASSFVFDLKNWPRDVCFKILVGRLVIDDVCSETLCATLCVNKNCGIKTKLFICCLITILQKLIVMQY